MEEWKEFHNVKVSSYGRVETKKGVHYGYDNGKGYKRIKLENNCWIRVHRLVAHLFLGLNLSDNSVEVNHKDCDTTNNNVNNLELVSHRQNMQRTIKHINGKLVGTYYDKSRNKWNSKIVISGKQKFLGRFNTEQEAHERYLEELKKVTQ